MPNVTGVGFRLAKVSVHFMMKPQLSNVVNIAGKYTVYPWYARKDKRPHLGSVCL